MNLVVTGSSSGIGRALAARLIGRGHRVWGLARSAQTAPAAAPASAFRSSLCDVADWTQVERAAAEVKAAWEKIDGLVCCAAVQGEIGPALTADPRRWTATVRADLDGTYHALRAFHPLTAGARRAKIICFSGGGATTARPNFSAYGAAKTAVVRLVETVAAEAGATLDINAVAPGAIATRLTDEVIALGAARAGEAEYAAAVKLKQQGPAPLDQALALVEWLLSPASDGISGRLISAAWDDWEKLDAAKLAASDLYKLRRVTPP